MQLSNLIITAKIYYFLLSPNEEADRMVSAKTTKQSQSKFKDIFTGIGCFEGMFPFLVKDDNKPYQALPRHVAHACRHHSWKD